MNTIQFQNHYGETIQVKQAVDGRVRVSHSDITPEGRFGEFLDVGTTYAGQSIIGAVLVFRGTAWILNAHEAGMIRNAVQARETSFRAS